MPDKEVVQSASGEDTLTDVPEDTADTGAAGRRSDHTRHEFGLIGQRLFSALRVLRAPLAVSVIAFLVFAFTQQLQEIYRVHAESIVVGGGNLQLLATVLVAALMGLVIWYAARHLTDRLVPPSQRKRFITRQILRWSPRLMGALPQFGIALGLYLASPLREMQDEYGAVAAAKIDIPPELSAVHHVLTIGSYLFLGLGLALIFGTFIRSLGRMDGHARGGWLFKWQTHLLFFLALAAFVGLCVAFPVALTQAVGTMLIILLFVIMLSMLVTQLTFVADRTGIPIITIMIAAALIYYFLDLNDNHFVRNTKGEPQVQPVFVKDVLGPNVQDSFEQWLAARGDRQAFAGKTYPVYVVAAQGGGLYAAYHAAQFLGRMQDLCPVFAQHVFAVSGVSGGSLGASIFAALAKKMSQNGAHQKCRDPKDVFASEASEHNSFQVTSDEILASDFLSPLVFGTLFPDMLQRFIPYPVAQLDRTVYLERAFAAGWNASVAQTTDSEAASENPFSADFLKLWQPDGVAPALLLNMTEAKTGLPWIISPFDMQGIRVRNFPQWEGDKYLRGLTRAGGRKITKRITLPLGQAVSLSSRAPGITPPASLIVQHDRYSAEKVQLVDGAFFDNSGVESAMHLIRKLDKIAPRLKAKYGIDVQVNLIVLTSGKLAHRPVSDDRAGTLLSPLAALNSTRTARSYYAIFEAENELDRRTLKGLQGEKDLARVRLPRVRRVSFEKLFYNIPLGWHLSPVTRFTIRQQLGDFRKCPAPDENFENTNFIANGQIYLQNVNCVQRSIMHELNGDMASVLAKLSDKRRNILSTAGAKRDEIRRKLAAAQNDQRFDRSYFFACASNNFYKKKLTPDQRDGLEVMLNYFTAYPELYPDKRWLAFAMALSKLKTVSRMQPVREALCETNDCAVDRITRNLRANKSQKRNRAIPELETGKNYYGRGHVQLTLVRNYKRVGETLGLGQSLYYDPDLALDKYLSVYIMFEGMRQGLFRQGHNLGRYFDGQPVTEANWIEGYNIVGKLQPADRSYLKGTLAKWGQAFDRCLKPKT